MAVTVFVADPLPLFCEALSVALEEDNHLKVLGWSSDPHETIPLARSLSPDVILCDLEFTRSSSTFLRDLKGIAVAIVLTRGQEGDAILKAAEAGALGCVGHQTDVATLSSLIAQASDGRFLVDPERLGETLRRAGAAGREDDPPDLSRLTAREREILDLLAAGLDNSAIASQLHVSTHTVRTHVGHVLRKLGVRSRSEAVRIALGSGASGATASVLRIEGPLLREE